MPGHERCGIVPFGQQHLDSAQESGEWLLVEGESDTLCGAFHDFPALGLPGASMAKVLDESHVEGIDRVLLHQEPGGGGREFVAGVARRLAEIGFGGDVVAFDLHQHGVGDLAELHVADPESFARRLRMSIDAGPPVDLEPLRPKRRTANPTPGRLSRGGGSTTDDFRRAKEQIDIADLLDQVCGERRGDRWRSPWGGGWTVTCTTRDAGIFRCWSTGARGDVVALCMAAYGDTFAQAIARLGLPDPYASKDSPQNDEPVDVDDFAGIEAIKPAPPRPVPPPHCSRSAGMVLRDGNARKVVGAHAVRPASASGRLPGMGTYGNDARPNDPSPEEIARACAEIQAGWDDGTRERRCRPDERPQPVPALKPTATPR